MRVRHDATRLPLLASCLVPAVVLIAGVVLWGGPADPDAPFGMAAIIGLLLVYLATSLGTIGWGARLTRAAGWNTDAPWTALVLGPLLASWLAFALGQVGGLSVPGSRALWMTLPLAGWAWVPWRSLARGSRRLGRDPIAVAGTAIVAALLLPRGLRALVPQAHSDPLLYHLVAPRLWWQEGAIAFPRSFAVGLNASFWEYFLLWRQAWTFGPGGRGLIEGQLLGQWDTFLFGLVPSVMALRSILSAFPAGRGWGPLLGIPALLSLSLVQFSSLAKNDWGLMAWILFAVASAARARSTRPAMHAVAAWAALGTAAAGKWIHLLTVSALGIWILGQYVRISPAGRRIRLGLVCLVAAVPIVAIAARNYTQTGNPCFPWMQNVFPSSWLGPSTASNPAVQQGIAAFNLNLLKQSLQILISENPLQSTWLAPVLAAVLVRGFRPVLPLLASTWLATLLVLTRRSGDVLQLRWLAPELVLLAGIHLLALLSLVRSLIVRWSWSAATVRCLATLMLAILAVGPFWAEWTRATRDLVDLGHAATRIRDPFAGFAGGEAKAWLRMAPLAPSEVIFSTADNQTYYVSHLPMVNLRDNSRVDTALHQEADPAAWIRRMRDWGGRYLLDTLHFNSLPNHQLIYWGDYSVRLQDLLLSHPEAWAFQGVDSWVIDLTRLEQSLEGVCRAEPTPGWRAIEFAHRDHS
jgi:hypothetical protein